MSYSERINLGIKYDETLSLEFKNSINDYNLVYDCKIAFSSS